MGTFLKSEQMVSIITVNYNGWKNTCELIASLKQFETYPYEMIVVDNASAGDDVHHIRAIYPDVKLIQSDKNLGFAGGNNIGFMHAKGDYIFFLNNDMLLKGAILEPMVSRLSDKSIGGVSPCVCFLYDPEQIQYFGYKRLGKITLRHKTEKFDLSQRDSFLKSKETEVLYGGAMMVRRDVIEKVGKMPEIYFLFAEEFDWSARIFDGGYELWYEAASIIYHKGGGSIGYGTPLRAYYMSRARLLFARRNKKGLEKFLSCTYLVLISMTKNVIGNLLAKDFKKSMALCKGTWHGIFDNKN